MSRMQEITYENAVRNIQRYLRQIIYFEPDISEFVPLDGIYGDRTRDAVLGFQRKRGIAENGIVDRLTLNRLFEEYLLSIAKNSSGRSISPFYDFPADYELKIGDENSLVAIIRIMLEELSGIYNFLSDVSGDEGKYYNEDLAALIRRYQAINNITDSGRINKETWNRLASDYDRALRINVQL